MNVGRLNYISVAIRAKQISDTLRPFF